MERKKLIELIGSIFVAFIFISSYAAFGVSPSSQGPKPKSNSTQLRFIYASAFANATIYNFSNTFTISYKCDDSKVNATLQSLESNGSVANYYQISPNSIYVDSGTMSTASLLSYLSNTLNSSCTSLSATAKVALPSKLSFYFPSSRSSFALSIPSSMRYYSVPVLFNSSLHSINVSIAAIVEANGTIYNMSVSRVSG